jgi:hypothetical protein
LADQKEVSFALFSPYYLLKLAPINEVNEEEWKTSGFKENPSFADFFGFLSRRIISLDPLNPWPLEP